MIWKRCKKCMIFAAKSVGRFGSSHSHLYSSYSSSSAFVIFNLVCGHQLRPRTLFSNFYWNFSLIWFPEFYTIFLFLFFFFKCLCGGWAERKRLSTNIIYSCNIGMGFLVIFRWIFCLYFLDCHCKEYVIVFVVIVK